MRIVVISDWFAAKMGYAENCLPKALAALGHEVHVVTSDVQPYFDSPDYAATYEPFIGPAIQPQGVSQLDGFALHRLPHAYSQGKLTLIGLAQKLAELKPHIVQTFEVACPSTIAAASNRLRLGYRLFTGNHICASVYPPATGKIGKRERINLALKTTLPGRFVSLLSDKCYPATADCHDIAVRFFGVARSKADLCPLGVDTLAFYPVRDAATERERAETRSRLGFALNEIVCIYTGRFSRDKNPMCLAEAIGKLVANGAPYRGLFIGDGPKQNLEFIAQTPGCTVHPFVPASELPALYRACDIGVWPQQESTSMLDAAACGLPIVVSDRVQATERVEGNGVRYHEPESDDLARALETLTDAVRRKEMGSIGAARMASQYSWSGIAERRLTDYRAALRWPVEKEKITDSEAAA
jgi:glycosyltransferase involved in cell wall biosynthesis